MTILTRCVLWSSLFIPLQSQAAPVAVTNFTAEQDAQIRLSWTVPSPQPNQYDIRWSTTGPVSNDADFSTATPLGAVVSGFTVAPTGQPAAVGAPGALEVLISTGLKPSTTFYWAIKSSDDGGTSWSPISNSTRAVAGSFSLFQMLKQRRDGDYEQFSENNYAWGDIDGDGDLDLIAGGGRSIVSSGLAEVTVYRNDVSTFVQIQAFSDMMRGSVVLGDLDNDGDLDLVLSGDSAGPKLKVYRNDGGPAPFVLVQEPLGAGSGLLESSLALGDYDGDGRLDLAALGDDSGVDRFLLFRNTGSTSPFVLVQQLLGAGQGLTEGSVAFADFDQDGDLDLAAVGGGRFVVFKNSGGLSPFSLTQEPMGTGLGVAAGDMEIADVDADGDEDIIVAGLQTGGANYLLRVYVNAGGTFSLGANLDAAYGFAYGALGLGDFDNDGDIDLAAYGQSFPTERRLSILANNGAGAFAFAQRHPKIELSRPSEITFSDFDRDGDLDLVIGDTDGLHVNKSLEADFGNVNSTASPPIGLAASLPTGGTVQLTFSGGDYDGSGSSQTLYYQVAVATCSAAPCLTLDGSGFEITGPGQFISSPRYATPMRGTRVRPRAALGTNGLRLNFAALVENATYYFRAATIDAGLRRSSWSLETSIYVSEPPAAVANLAAAATANEDEAVLTWTAAGDNGGAGTAASSEIRYSSSLVIGAGNFSQADLWNAARPVGGAAGTSEVETVTGLVPGVTYYFALKTRDALGNTSVISNVASYLTGQDIVPAVAGVTPADNQVGVEISTVVALRFSKSMAAAACGNALSVRASRDKDGAVVDALVAGATVYASATKTLTFTPAAVLSKNVTYEIGLTTACQDLANAPLLSSRTWRFVTIMDYQVGNVAVHPSGLSFTVPAGAFAQDGAIVVSTSPQDTMISVASQKLARRDGFSYPIKTMDFSCLNAAGAALQPALPLSVTVPYDDADDNGVIDGSNPPVRANTLALWQLDTATQNWVRLPGGETGSSSDAVISPLPHFSVFALIGGQDTSLSRAFAFPVPYVPARQTTRVITFQNLSSRATIKIYTLSGRLVRSIDEADGDGQATWDVRNSEGRDVASGLYFYLIRNDAETKKGELVIVR